MVNRLGGPALLQAEGVNISYGSNHVVKSVELSLRNKSVYSLIGPSGCGKSTLLRCFNRMNDFIPSFSLQGSIKFKGTDIYSSEVDPVLVRKKVGMVFQKPNPFPNSIRKNITWGPKINGYQGDFDELLESSLKKAALWDEVKDRLDSSGMALSGGQQQRLCIARAIAMNPDVILMDEPCASLDPISTEKIEELITELKKQFGILVVTHNMQQAMRISDFTAFMYQGELIEFGLTDDIFNRPKKELTHRYVSGKFG